MAISLDDLPQIKALDKSGMLQILERFPEDSRSAIERVKEASLESISDRPINEIVFAGVGGSSIGGKLIIDWLWGESIVPMVLSRGFHLPAFVDEETLVFTVSYSGNTEETLSMLAEAAKAGSTLVTVTSGGTMANVARENDYPLILLPEGYQPRAAIPHQFFSVATAMHNLGLVESPWEEVPEALTIMDSIRDEISIDMPADHNPAKKVAMRLIDKIPLVYGSPLFEGVAYRFGSQLNENSKVPSGSGVFPEAFHNAVLGSEGNPDSLAHLALLLLRDNGDDKRMKNKIERFKELFTPSIGDIIELEANGSGRLSRILSLVYIGDYISSYLGLLHGHDPSSNQAIDEVKKV
jgi:glucose/mannose-6-phosphate isomerase